MAFNARVAAARAGEPGREFAVVADVLSNITDESTRLAQTGLEAGR